MEEKKEKPQRPKCSKCGSAFTYLRIKEGSIVCRSCGNVDQKVDG
jgi:ribosomal protein L37AE/L43A